MSGTFKGDHRLRLSGDQIKCESLVTEGRRCIQRMLDINPGLAIVSQDTPLPDGSLIRTTKTHDDILLEIVTPKGGKKKPTSYFQCDLFQDDPEGEPEETDMTLQLKSSIAFSVHPTLSWFDIPNRQGNMEWEGGAGALVSWDGTQNFGCVINGRESWVDNLLDVTHEETVITEVPLPAYDPRPKRPTRYGELNCEIGNYHAPYGGGGWDQYLFTLTYRMYFESATNDDALGGSLFINGTKIEGVIADGENRWIMGACLGKDDNGKILCVVVTQVFHSPIVVPEQEGWLWGDEEVWYFDPAEEVPSLTLIDTIEYYHPDATPYTFHKAHVTPWTFNADGTKGRALRSEQVANIAGPQSNHRFFDITLEYKGGSVTCEHTEDTSLLEWEQKGDTPTDDDLEASDLHYYAWEYDHYKEANMVKETDDSGEFLVVGDEGYYDPGAETGISTIAWGSDGETLSVLANKRIRTITATHPATPAEPYREETSSYVNDLYANGKPLIDYKYTGIVTSKHLVSPGTTPPDYLDETIGNAYEFDAVLTFNNDEEDEQQQAFALLAQDADDETIICEDLTYVGGDPKHEISFFIQRKIIGEAPLTNSWKDLPQENEFRSVDSSYTIRVQLKAFIKEIEVPIIGSYLERTINLRIDNDLNTFWSSWPVMSTRFAYYDYGEYIGSYNSAISHIAPPTCSGFSYNGWTRPVNENVLVDEFAGSIKCATDGSHAVISCSYLSLARFLYPWMRVSADARGSNGRNSPRWDTLESIGVDEATELAWNKYMLNYAIIYSDEEEESDQSTFYDLTSQLSGYSSGATFLPKDGAKGSVRVLQLSKALFGKNVEDNKETFGILEKDSTAFLPIGIYAHPAEEE